MEHEGGDGMSMSEALSWREGFLEGHAKGRRIAEDVVELTDKTAYERGYKKGYAAAREDHASDRPVVTDEMVRRFLGWRLPKHFVPDAGISFTPPTNECWWPVGTNLFDAGQARAMLEHVMGCVPREAGTDCDPELSEYFTKVQAETEAQQMRSAPPNPKPINGCDESTRHLGYNGDDNVYTLIRQLFARCNATDAEVAKLREQLRHALTINPRRDFS